MVKNIKVHFGAGCDVGPSHYTCSEWSKYASQNKNQTMPPLKKDTKISNSLLCVWKHRLSKITYLHFEMTQKVNGP